MEKRTKRYRKGNIFHYSEGSRCKRIWCATNCAAKGQRDTVMVFFSPTPGFIVLTLQREWIAEIPSLKSHKKKRKTGKKFRSCFPRCCAVIAAFLFFCYLDLVPECDVATSVSQMISCVLGLPAWWRPAERKSSRLCCKTRKFTSKSFHLNC